MFTKRLTVMLFENAVTYYSINHDQDDQVNKLVDVTYLQICPSILEEKSLRAQ